MLGNKNPWPWLKWMDDIQLDDGGKTPDTLPSHQKRSGDNRSKLRHKMCLHDATMPKSSDQPQTMANRWDSGSSSYV